MIDLAAKGESPCHNNGGCKHLCLLKPSDSGGLTRVCACPENHDLASDNRTCIMNCKRSALATCLLLLCIFLQFSGTLNQEKGGVLHNLLYLFGFRFELICFMVKLNSQVLLEIGISVLPMLLH